MSDETTSPDSGPSMPFIPGVIVDGKYRLERPLARGGMGFVVLGRHVQLDLPVALKFMHAWLAHTVPKGAARFLDEARAAARLQSDHVARVSDTGTFQGSPYMVMEYLEGEDLETLLRRQPALPVAVAVRYALQASEALGEAHAAGIVHRDLKPANLFLARRSDGSTRIKLLDFGISKMVGGVAGPNPAWEAADSPEAAEMNAAVCGSPLYMAPEQMLSSSKTDTRTDIWALGVVLYEMLAGVRPFTGENLAELCSRVLDPRPTPLREIRPEVPVVLESAVMQCLQKDPDFRFQSVSAFAHALASPGAGGTRAAAARIDRIVKARSARASADAEANTVVPEGALTRTSFNRAVDGLAVLMNLGGGAARASADARAAEDRATAARVAAVRAAETTPPPFAAQVVEIVDDEIWLRPTLRTRFLQLRARVRHAVSRRERVSAPVAVDPSVTLDSAWKLVRLAGRPRPKVLAVAGAGGVAIVALFFLFIARETPSQGPAATAAAARASLPATVRAATAATPQPPTPRVSPAPSAPSVPTASIAAATPWVPLAVPVAAKPTAVASAASPAPPAPGVSARARASNPARSAGGGGGVAPIGTTGFGGRE
ncbi:MAG TPA: serine/threonine-protein kinase [Polyangiaceae bacterium]|nr:serine/threonine-protein kinase [Polyangiaceae bacterium]